MGQSFEFDDPLVRDAERDLARIMPLLQLQTERRSRWNGRVVVRDLTFPAAGFKHRQCSIHLRQDVLLTMALRWTVMIHEGLHSVSAVFSLDRLDAVNRRWEEAIVEQLQRLLRPDIFLKLGIEVPASQLAILDETHPSNLDIRSLERVRDTAGVDPVPFYVGLLSSNQQGRAGTIVAALRARGSEP